MEVFTFITSTFKFWYINAMKKVIYASIPFKDKISRLSIRQSEAVMLLESGMHIQILFYGSLR